MPVNETTFHMSHMHYIVSFVSHKNAKTACVVILKFNITIQAVLAFL